MENYPEFLVATSITLVVTLATRLTNVNFGCQKRNLVVQSTIFLQKKIEPVQVNVK
jgi:hypothetical protein